MGRSHGNICNRSAYAKQQRRLDDYIDDIMDVIDMLPLSPYLNHRLDAALRMMLLPAVQKGYAGIAGLPGRLHAERCPEADEMWLAAFYDQFVAKAAGKLIKIRSGTCGETRFST